MTQPISYVSDDKTRHTARPPRSARTWIKLLLAWGAGLVSWTIYIALILYVFFRIIL